MTAGRTLLALAALSLAACSTAETGSDGGADRGDPGPGETGETREADELPPFSDGAQTGVDPLTTCNGTAVGLALAAADSRAFANASRAVTALLQGSWPATPPSSAELFAYLGPHRGPQGGRFIARLEGERADAFYLSAPVMEPVHVIAVLDLGPSIRSEVPLISEALQAMAARLATSGLSDRLSIVEWTDDAPVGLRLAQAVDAPVEVASYVEQLQSRVQFGGDPSLSVVQEQVLELAEAADDVPAHVLLLTDGSMGSSDPDAWNVAAAWREAEIGVTVAELQGFDPMAAEEPPIHVGLLDDKRLADAGFYVAAAIQGDPVRPSARAVVEGHRWQLTFLFGDRFDDLIRPSSRRARFEVSAPEGVGLIPLLASETDGGQTGLRRLGSSSVAFTQALATGSGCSSFQGKVRLLTREASGEIELAAAEVSFSSESETAHHALLAALDWLEPAIGAASCSSAELEQIRGKLESASPEGMDPEEEAAFGVSRDRTLLVLDALKPLCT